LPRKNTGTRQVLTSIIAVKIQGLFTSCCFPQVCLSLMNQTGVWGSI
jgi:hypothetical protein